MDELRRMLREYDERIANLERGLVIKKITIPADGQFIVKVLSADPGSPVANEMWINSSTHHLKIYLNGVVTIIV